MSEWLWLLCMTIIAINLLNFVILSEFYKYSVHIPEQFKPIDSQKCSDLPVLSDTILPSKLEHQ